MVGILGVEGERQEERRLAGMSGMGQVWRHMRTDRTAIAKSKLDRGTVRRVLSFARPHRGVDRDLPGADRGRPCLVVVTPLLVQRIVDDGIFEKDTALVIERAPADGGDVCLRSHPRVIAGSLSSRIGRAGLRPAYPGVRPRAAPVPGVLHPHPDRALVSRLNNDVIGAQRAFTSTLSSTVSNAISVLVVGIAMIALSWQVTLLCLLLFPLLLVTSRLVSTGSPG